MCQRREERPSSIQLWIAAVESVMKFGSAPQSTIDSEVAGSISGAGTLSRSIQVDVIDGREPIVGHAFERPSRPVCPQRSPPRLDTALRP
jgi:hypothetical protein